jgi:AsmA protein
MNKFIKISAIIAGAVVVLVVALIVLAQILITPERVRETVLPLAEKALHRQVALGEIDVSLFSGVSIQDLRVKEKTGEEDFIAADRIVLRYRIWPLFFLRVVVDEVRLEGPKIRIVRLADGSFNFDDLTAPAAAETSLPKVEPGADKGTEINILVSRVAVSDGEVLFFDHAAGSATPYRYQFSDLALEASDLSLDRPFPFSAKVRINGSVLTLDGEANVTEASGKVKINLAGLDITAFAPYYRNALPGNLEGLKLSLDVVIEGGAKKLSSKGSVVFKELDLILDAMKESPLRDARLNLDYVLDVDLVAKILTIGSSRAVFNGVVVEFDGTVSGYDVKPLLDLNLALPGLDLRRTLAALPENLVAAAKEMDPAGTIDARIHLAGTLEDPAKLLRDGEVRLTDVAVSAGGMRPALNGRIDLKGDTLQAEKLQLKIGDNLLLIDLQGKNIFGDPVVVSSRISADNLLVDPLLGTAPTAAAGAAPAQKDGTAAEELGPFAIPLRASGEVRVKQALYKGLAIDALALDWRLEKNVLTVERLTGNLAEGAFTQNARVDLGKKGLVYTTALELKGVQADPLVTAFAPKSAGTLFGLLDLTASFDGRGTLAETLKKNLSGKGRFQLTEARLTGAGIARGLAEYLQLEELRDVRFAKAAGDFTIEKGRVRVAADFAGSKLRLSPRGSAGLDGTLDLVLDTRLSPELTRKLDSHGKVSGYFKDAQGWGQVPLKLTGTVAAPRFTLDASAVKGQVKEKALEQLQKTLEKKLFKKGTPAEPGTPESQDPAKKALDDAIKGLFGR